MAGPPYRSIIDSYGKVRWLDANSNETYAPRKTVVRQPVTIDGLEHMRHPDTLAMLAEDQKRFEARQQRDKEAQAERVRQDQQVLVDFNKNRIIELVDGLDMERQVEVLARAKQDGIGDSFELWQLTVDTILREHEVAKKFRAMDADLALSMPTTELATKLMTTPEHASRLRGEIVARLGMK